MWGIDFYPIQRVLKIAGVSYLSLRQYAIDSILEAHPPSFEANPHLKNISLSSLTVFTIGLASKKSIASGSNEVGSLDFLASILEINDDKSFDFLARTILFKNGLTVSKLTQARGAVLDNFSHLDKHQITQKEEVSEKLENQKSFEKFMPNTTESMTATNEDSFSKYFRDITADAEAGKIDRSFGRDQEITDIEIVLSRRKKGNPILVGEPGVGKTSLVEELACRIITGDVGPKLKNTRIMSLDLSALVGGTRYRGDLEERLKDVLENLKKDTQKIVFIDEIHALITPGSSASAAVDILKPALASGEIRCIGATTQAEYKRYFESDEALSRRFIPIHLKEPSRDETVNIIENIIANYEKSHNVCYPDGIIELIVDQTISLIPERRLPDKAIDIIDDMGARASMAGLSTATEATLAESISARTGRINNNLKSEIIIEKLSQEMPEQENAARLIVQAFLRIALPGYTGHNSRVIAIVGPSSANKSNAAKLLAKVCNKPFAEINMADFHDNHSTTGLTGAPPGFIGHENGGSLYDAVIRARGGVLFIKDIEKASPAAQNIITTAISDGSITDSMQKTTSLSAIQVIISMNIEDEKSQIGFMKSDTDVTKYNIEAIDNADAVIKMKTPNATTKENLIKLNIERLQAQSFACGCQMNVNSLTIEDI